MIFFSCWGSVVEPSDIGVSIVSLQMAGDGTVRLSRPASVTEPFESPPLCTDHNVNRLGVGTRDQLSAHTKLRPGDHLLHLDASTLYVTRKPVILQAISYFEEEMSER